MGVRDELSCVKQILHKKKQTQDHIPESPSETLKQSYEQKMVALAEQSEEELRLKDGELAKINVVRVVSCITKCIALAPMHSVQTYARTICKHAPINIIAV